MILGFMFSDFEISKIHRILPCEMKTTTFEEKNKTPKSSSHVKEVDDFHILQKNTTLRSEQPPEQAPMQDMRAGSTRFDPR